jgi:glycine/D-amino acid oxidase-like deaminating enzyme
VSRERHRSGTVQRSYWLREALADEEARAEPLVGAAACDVAIVGGGYTGMWTAYALTQRAPGIRILLLEQDICGAGPSGRNGGFLHGWWDQLPLLVDLYGPEQALELAWAADESVAGIGDFCVRHDVDAWFRRAGYLQMSASAAQDGDWEETVRTCARLGVGEQYHELSGEEARRRCDSPVFRGAAIMPSAATVQPARLARGLRHVLLERGVQIHEGTRVRRVVAGSPMRILTERGEATAPQVVLGLNAWAAGWPGFRTSLLAWGSHIVLTEPIADRLRALGWVGGEGITDSRFTIHYFRTTADGRIAFGAGVGAAGYGGRIGTRFDHDERAAERARAGLARLFPMLSDVRFTDAWGGPIDISSDRLPAIGSRAGGRVHFAHGYSGNGVGPAFLAGRILAARIDGGDDRLARLPIVNRRAKAFPPEPMRYVGARLIREALIRHDEASDAGRRPGPIVRFLAALPRLLGYRLSP